MSDLNIQTVYQTHGLEPCMDWEPEMIGTIKVSEMRTV